MSEQQVLVLTVRSQKQAGEKVFRLHKKRVVLGSATSSDIKLDDASISPVHAILEANGPDGKPVLYDLASETGIEVNGKPAIQVSLNPQDQVRIGPYMISLKVQNLSEMPQSPELVKESFGQKLFFNDKEDFSSLLLEDGAELIEIFDRRPESKQSLQVVMFYHDTILDVEHFVNEKHVLIGPGSREDFAIPPLLNTGSNGSFELVSSQNGQYHLRLHDSMKGVLGRKGQMVSVEEFMQQAGSSSEKTYPLDTQDFAKVQIQDISFFLSFTSAPPRLKLPRLTEKDPVFAKIWMISLLMTGLIIFALSSITVNSTIEIEQLPERVATILYEPKPIPVPIIKKPVEVKPEPKIEEPKPKPVEKPVEVKKEPPKPKVIHRVEPEKPKEVEPVKKPEIAEKVTPTPPKKIEVKEPKPQPKPVPQKQPKAPGASNAKATGAMSGNEGAGAKAKGPEGSRGKPDAPKSSTPQTKAVRPGSAPGKSAGLERGHSQAQGMGVVDVFKSNQGALSKIFAGGKGITSSAEKLEGYSGFTTKGEGGLGAAGSQKGGGGQSMGLGGLADKGPGGGKKGTGLGALGSGGNMLGGKGKLMIEGGGSSDAVVIGSIDEDAIARELERHRDEFKYCYEKELNAENPDLSGRVGVRFVIGASGSVTKTAVTSTSLHNANTERCVLDVIRRIDFPPVRGGGVAEVTKTFVYKPSNR
jgi:outer membrane biosynthesis protein TonB/pSer/pThr/pTyr-binding forkhead associated (FHA) protein